MGCAVQKYATFLMGLVFVLSGGPALPQGTPEANTSQADALRKRVEEYYSLLQAGRYTQAEDYMTPDSKEPFRRVPKSAFLGFEIKTLNLDSDKKTAAVVVQVQAFMPGLSSQPVEMPYNSNWRLVDGVWYLVFPKEMPMSPLSAISNNTSTPQIPRTEELKFKGHHYNLAKIDRGQKKVARFPFTNVTDHVVTITQVITGTPLLTVENYKKEYKPGESGVLAIDFVPDDIERDYAQTVVFRTNPGNTITHLLVTAYITPKPGEPVKEPAMSRPVATQPPQ
jgi:uncharacterized protein DUF1573